VHTRMTDFLTIPDAALPLPIYASSFAKKAGGSSKAADDDDSDDDDDDSDDDDSDDDDDEDDDDEDADKSDEELRAELKSIRESLKKANGQSAARRKKLREREAELAEARKPKPKSKKDGESDDVDLDTVRAEAKAEGEKAGNLRAKRAEAKSSLLAAGVAPERVQRALGMLDLDELDLDDDGLDGIDEAISELKKDVPEFFGSRRRRRQSVAGEGDRDGDRPRKKNLTASERQAALLTGGR
jgi:hypothetical protein